MQSIKSGLKFSVTEASVSSINPNLTDVFGPRSRFRWVGVKLSESNFFLNKELLLIDLKLGTHTK